jgi:3-phenylpropionate/trans-cinnamate dioxygenase ferredoxin component
LKNDLSDYSLVAKSADVVEGEVIARTVDGVAIALARAGGTVYAMRDKCSHQGCPLSTGFIEDLQIECEAHGGMFDLATGEATLAPATEPIVMYSVQEIDGDVFVKVAPPAN